MLHVNQLSFAYPKEKHLVLDNINFKLDSGKILAIVGPSGCGKTTLLKLIFGLLAPIDGNIQWNTDVIPNPKNLLVPGFNKMKLVEQHSNLMPYIKVYENMQQHILHLTEEEREPILKYWLDFLGIKDIENKKAKDLSGGQMQRVAIAKAFIAEAELLLLDEPFSNLDTVTKSYLISDLKNLIKQRNATAIAVVHQPEDALEIADEIAVLNNGSIVQLGTPNQVYNQPTTETVAELFGICNFFSKENFQKIFSGDCRQFSLVEKEILVRPHQMQLSAIKIPFARKEELYKGSYTLTKVSTEVQDFWINLS